VPTFKPNPDQLVLRRQERVMDVLAGLLED